MPDTATDTLLTLERLLAQERQTLLDGALDEIGPLMQRKEDLIAQLPGDPPPDVDRIRRLHDSMLRNQTLFDQALAGLRNATDRLAITRQLRRSMEVYDSTGRRATIDLPATRQVERRA